MKVLILIPTLVFTAVAVALFFAFLSISISTYVLLEQLGKVLDWIGGEDAD